MKRQVKTSNDLHYITNVQQSMQPGRLGSSLFSADDMFPRLQMFRSQLEGQGFADKPLFFAKVDVRSCFDTIPQNALMNTLDEVFTANEYSIGKYAEAKMLGGVQSAEPTDSAVTARVAWKYQGMAQPAGQDLSLSQVLQAGEAITKSGKVFVDSIVRRYESRNKIVDLLRQHVQKNMVQIGKTHYRQKAGIPQGSIVSSLLCSFFYAELEQKVLGFVNEKGSLLLRLIDDFLLITTKEKTARRFVEIVHAGVPEYGVAIKAEKSLVNFDVNVGGQKIARLSSVSDFPYCGNTINTVSLDITKDKERRNRSSEYWSCTDNYHAY